MHLLLERGSFLMQPPASTACQLWHFVQDVLVLFSRQRLGASAAGVFRLTMDPRALQDKHFFQ